MTDSYVTDVLGLLQRAELMHESTPVIWRVEGDGPRVRFAMLCNDTFYWGCADAEDILSEDVPLLRECLDDLKAADPDGELWLATLFCARKRGMRPMNRWLKYAREQEWMPDSVLALFEAAGPQRESVFGAP